MSLFDESSAPEVRSVADRELQKMAEAYGCAQMLEPCVEWLSLGSPACVVLFAAHALHASLRACVLKPANGVPTQRSHLTLSDDEWRHIRDTLFSLLDRHWQDTRLESQLAHALAACLIKLPTTVQHQDRIAYDAIQSIRSTRPRLSLLRALPDEVESARMRPDLRTRHIEALSASKSIVVAAIVMAEGKDHWEHIFRTATPWLAMIDDKADSPQSLLLSRALAALYEPTLHDEALLDSAAAVAEACLSSSPHHTVDVLAEWLSGLDPSTLINTGRRRLELVTDLAAAAMAIKVIMLEKRLRCLNFLARAHEASRFSLAVDVIAAPLAEAWGAVTAERSECDGISILASALVRCYCLCWPRDEVARDLATDAVRAAYSVGSREIVISTAVSALYTHEGIEGGCACARALLKHVESVEAARALSTAVAAACENVIETAVDPWCICGAIGASVVALAQFPEGLELGAIVARLANFSARLACTGSRWGAIALLHTAERSGAHATSAVPATEAAYRWSLGQRLNRETERASLRLGQELSSTMLLRAYCLLAPDEVVSSIIRKAAEYCAANPHDPDNWIDLCGALSLLRSRLVDLDLLRNIMHLLASAPIRSDTSVELEDEVLPYGYTVNVFAALLINWRDRSCLLQEESTKRSIYRPLHDDKLSLVLDACTYNAQRLLDFDPAAGLVLLEIASRSRDMAAAAEALTREASAFLTRTGPGDAVRCAFNFLQCAGTALQACTFIFACLQTGVMDPAVVHIIAHFLKRPDTQCRVELICLLLAASRALPSSLISDISKAILLSREVRPGDFSTDLKAAIRPLMHCLSLSALVAPSSSSFDAEEQLSSVVALLVKNANLGQARFKKHIKLLVGGKRKTSVSLAADAPASLSFELKFEQQVQLPAHQHRHILHLPLEVLSSSTTTNS